MALLQHCPQPLAAHLVTEGFLEQPWPPRASPCGSEMQCHRPGMSIGQPCPQTSNIRVIGEFVINTTFRPKLGTGFAFNSPSDSRPHYSWEDLV